MMKSLVAQYIEGIVVARMGNLVQVILHSIEPGSN
jgi:hypothetical protein